MKRALLSPNITHTYLIAKIDNHNFALHNRMRGEQVVVSALMAYGTYIAYKCPCIKVLSCHLPHFFGSTLLAQAIVIAYNV